MSKKSALIHCIVAILVLVVSQGIASIWYVVNIEGLDSILFGITYVLLTYLLLNLFIKKYSKQSLASFYIPKFRISRKWFLIAIILPVLVLSMLFLFIPGSFYTNDFSFYENFGITIETVFATGLAVGMVEEMVFRGIIMHAIESCSNIKWGVLLPSFIFGCMHLLNGKLNLASVLLLLVGGTLVGIMFSLITYTNRSIWPSMIVHAFWNTLVIGGIVSFGADKDPYAISGYLFQNENIFLTGGEFGIEVSIFAIMGYIAVIIYLGLPQNNRLRDKKENL